MEGWWSTSVDPAVLSGGNASADRVSWSHNNFVDGHFGQRI